jgi:hypothetical protein
MQRRKSKTPQQKKAESYAHDRCNCYGENKKSSRKNIRRNKRSTKRVNRRRSSQAIFLIRDADPTFAESIERRIAGTPPKRWRKCRDMWLDIYIAYRLVRRVELGIDSEASAAKKIARISRCGPIVPYAFP